MVEVTVIGVEPPCVRCSLVVQRVYEQARLDGIEVRVQKLDCRSPEAQALAIEGLIRIEGICPSRETLLKAFQEVGLGT